MMIALHKNATTTPAVRAQIQQSSATEGELAAQYSISRTTVQRWKHRDSVEDRSHTPHRLQTTLNAGQEELVVYLRKQRKRGLDTLLTRSAPQTSTTGRSSANPTRQVVPSPGSMLAVRWLMRTTVPTTV